VAGIVDASPDDRQNRSRRGRWRTGEDSRKRILDAARACFAELGYDRTTIRGIASEAGVDPAMLYYFFTTKSQLFTTAMALPSDPTHHLSTMLRGDPSDLGTSLVRHFLEVWDGAGSFEPLFALMRSATTDEHSARMLREFLQGELHAQLAKAIGTEDAPLRTQLVFAHLMGLALTRYVIRNEPLASTPIEDIAKSMGPIIEQYLH
jgi:AcrR family transcriptional regulator